MTPRLKLVWFWLTGVNDMGDGSYVVSWYGEVRGEYSIHVTMGGTPGVAASKGSSEMWATPPLAGEDVPGSNHVAIT